MNEPAMLTLDEAMDLARERYRDALKASDRSSRQRQAKRRKEERGGLLLGLKTILRLEVPDWDVQFDSTDSPYVQIGEWTVWGNPYVLRFFAPCADCDSNLQYEVRGMENFGALLAGDLNPHFHRHEFGENSEHPNRPKARTPDQEMTAAERLVDLIREIAIEER